MNNKFDLVIRLFFTLFLFTFLIVSAITSAPDNLDKTYPKTSLLLLISIFLIGFAWISWILLIIWL